MSATQAVSPQPPLTLRLDRLVSWRELPELKHHAGAATCTTTFDLKPELIANPAPPARRRSAWTSPRCVPCPWKREREAQTGWCIARA